MGSRERSRALVPAIRGHGGRGPQELPQNLIKGPGRRPPPHGGDDKRDIWLINQDGTGPKRLTTDPGEDTFPVFSHDGQRVILTSFRDVSTQTYSVRINGTEEVNLSNNSFFDTTPVADPNGGHLLFVSNRLGDYDFWVMDLDGSNQSRSHTIAGDEFHPSSTMDGSQIVYYSAASGARQIYIINAAGGTPVQLTNHPEGNFKTSTLIGPRGPGPTFYSPARTGRQDQCAQENPEWPHPPLPEAPPVEPLREPVRTPTEEKIRSAFFEPQEGQSGFRPSEYSDMDTRTSKVPPQSGQW